MTGNMGSNEVVVSRSRPNLLPGILGLALLDGIISLLGKLPVLGSSLLIGIALVVPIVYLAWLILTTRDLLQQPHQLHSRDLWLSRWSGLLALCMFVAEFGCMALSDFLPQSKLLQPPGVYAFLHHAAEWGLVFSCICLFVRPPIRHVPPRFAWKLIAVPLLFIFGMEFILWAMIPALGEHEPATSVSLWLPNLHAAMTYPA